ncbi:MAG: tannase/feruloyl esterase family alpha/beta hydrolase [Agathobacter sp.]|nr:tannase/feruloyl esterase family alpha/beta hydrolase [Agathobacter sp.]
MLEREKINFFDTTKLQETTGLEARANCTWLQGALNKAFPQEEIYIDQVQIVSDGTYQPGGKWVDKILKKKLTGLPKFVEVKLRHKTGDFYENIIVWSPFAWNDRFATTCGGGTGIGGESYITVPDNTSRGWTMGLALMNGFTAVTANAANTDGMHDFMVDSKTRKLHRELYDNWRAETTHNMTVIGKEIAKLLHNRPVKYSYIHGGSGGGRQTMMAVQNYPNDFDGAWASCPAIYWPKFLLGGLWMIAMMKERNHRLTAEKLEFFTEKAKETAGGEDNYYKQKAKMVFNPKDYIGCNTKKGIITEKDAQMMSDILGGAKDKKGNLLFPLYRPGVKFWNVGLPVGGMYYSLFTRKPKLFIVSTHYLRWVTEEPKRKFENSSLEDFYQLYESSIAKFYDAMGDKSDLREFYDHGGKLMIDHGLNDPLIPVDGTICYFESLCETMGKDKVDDFVRLYLTPGDGHGNCWDKGPGLTENAGMKALIDWVENGNPPKELRGVRVRQKTGELMEEADISPVEDISMYK